jgi:predicted  nucleic acid-binding Zn-ribbon protein
MLKSEPLSLPRLAEASSRTPRHWIEIAEPISLAVSVVGAAAGMFFQQTLFAVTPVMAAISLNLANRYRRLQERTGEKSAVVLCQSQQLRGELQGLQDAFQALPLSQRLQKLEESVGRIGEAVVDVQQRQEEWQNNVDRDRQKTKETIAHLQQGLYNLNHHLSGDIGEVRSQIQSIHLSLSLPSPQIDDVKRQLVRLQAELNILVDRTTDRDTLNAQLEDLETRVEGLAQQQQESLQPGLRYLARAFQRLQKSAAEETKPQWAEDLDRRLDTILPYHYQMVTDSPLPWLLKAWEEGTEEVLIVSPQVSLLTPEFENVMAQLEVALERSIAVSIGWGDRSNIGKADHPTKPITLKPGGWRYHQERDPHQHYSAIPNLLEIKQRYPKLRLKLLGINDTLLVCDRAWMLGGGQSLLGLESQNYPKEIGLYTTDEQMVSTALDRFSRLRQTSSTPPRPINSVDNFHTETLGKSEAENGESKD